MRILHTSDWHVGKVLKGQQRLPEHIAVLADVVDIARREQPDLIIVAGDLYDTSAPSPDATRVVTRALTALRASGAAVAVIGGNHDNGPALDALRPWAEAAGIALRGTVRERADEHIITGTTGGGEAWRLVALPFLSQRHAVRATEMYGLTAAEAQQSYADHVGRLIAALSDDSPDTVHLVTAHLTVVGGTMGGGEREAHSILSYAVPATVFPSHVHYVALGHLHRAQAVIGPCPIRYSGSPLAIDFGEGDNTPSVSIIDATATTPAKVRQVPIAAALPLRTVRGTLAELGVAAAEVGEAWLRVVVRERPRAGLREQVQELLPRALEIRIDPELLPTTESPARPAAAGRSPRELFADYLASVGNEDVDVRALFDTLHDDVSLAGGSPRDGVSA